MKTTSTTQNLTPENESKAANAPEQIGAAELAEILGLTRQVIAWRANKESWLFETVSVRGGSQKLYGVSTLPIDIQRRIRIHYGEIPAELVECVPNDFDRERIERCAVAWDAARPWQRRLARARLEVLKRLEAWQEVFIGGPRAAVDAFVAAYRCKSMPEIEPEIYGIIESVSKSNLYDWRKSYQAHGIAGLISRNGWSRGKTGLPADQQKAVLGMLPNMSVVKAGRVARKLGAQFGPETASRRQVARFIARQKEKDPTLYQFLESPDGYKAKYQLALGSASEKAHHFLHYIEVDSTSADIMCSDGKRYTILGAIDIFSRKAKFQVTKTSSSWGIAALMRRIITDWGLPENVVRDNGQDYASVMVNEALTALDINVIAVPPFTPEAKPHIERVFGTLTRDLLEELPGYTGHNVADAQALRSRKAFSEQIGKDGKKRALSKHAGAPFFGKKGSPAPPPKKLSIIDGSRSDAASQEENPRGTSQDDLAARGGLMPAELQAAIDRWTEQVYHQRTHGSLGASPNARAASVPVRPRRIESHRALDILLAPAGERTVGKKGLRYENGLYWADELIDWVGRKVVCRVDMQDAGRIFCFDPDFRTDAGRGARPCAQGECHSPLQDGDRPSAFICEAVDLAISGISVADMIVARKRANKQVRERVRAIRSIASDPGGDPISEAIAEIRSQQATITNLPVGEPIEGNPFVDAAMAAAGASREGDGPVGAPLAAPGSAGVPAGVEEPLPDPPRQQGGSFPPLTGGLRGEIFDATSTNVIPISSKQVLREDLYFDTARERFDHFRVVQRTQPVSEWDIQLVVSLIDEWFDWADQFAGTWPESDRLWLGRIAPDRFPQYVENQCEEDGK